MIQEMVSMKVLIERILPQIGL
ncbi:hypothetical protein RB2501_15239 [Robiginitalea biformata HTCC2501]|uniref:Uncharacterized protein n=1 Tax=Robiginitalea biformata (strain ATCC BAA-864 / DSM 15991 / KCTC 12146 / HTCC2501) TaxID=313596 RepID=A4CLE5_ROBBH|nr:hypothetical protein RB2501_15239 [Robiginitalea biformata HTCC2501]